MSSPMGGDRNGTVGRERPSRKELFGMELFEIHEDLRLASGLHLGKGVDGKR